jgi:hypothetical protein
VQVPGVEPVFGGVQDWVVVCPQLSVLVWVPEHPQTPHDPALYPAGVQDEELVCTNCLNKHYNGSFLDIPGYGTLTDFGNPVFYGVRLKYSF